MSDFLFGLGIGLGFVGTILLFGLGILIAIGIYYGIMKILTWWNQ